MKKFDVPKDVKYILARIHEANEEAYIVGGCVRDLLLGIEPSDWDVTTSATPERVKKLFDRTIDTGLSHGTVTVMINKENYEVTTYRIDGKYEDYRRPKDVLFTRNLKEDLLRRDFTINAMAYNENEGVIDMYSGLEDLNHKVIRCVGNANDRFREDALRMLRAIRFSAKLGFDIENETYQAISKLAHLIKHISLERVNIELTKTLVSIDPEKMRELVNTGLIQYIIPEFMNIVDMDQNNPYHRFTVDEHSYECIKNIPPIPALRWTMYLHDLGKSETKTTDEKGIDHFYKHPINSERLARVILKRLKFDNRTIDKVSILVKYHDDRFLVTKKSVRKAINRIGIDNFEDFLLVKESDIKGQSFEFMDKHLLELKQIKELYQSIIKDGECLEIKDLTINGNDIIKLGVKNGKEVGVILNRLLEMVLEEPSLNTKENLSKLTIKLMIGE